jgi:hypothetical protein
MTDNEWVVVHEADGNLQAEIMRGLLEAQGIPVLLSQEGAGHFAYVTTVGSLGIVEVMVPSEHVQAAQRVLEEYDAGKLEGTLPETSSTDTEAPDQG